MSSCSALPFRLLYNLCILYPCRLIILLFVASPPRVAPLEPHVEEQNVGALVSSQEEHRVVDSPSDIATAHLDAVVGEGSDNYPPPVSIADAGRPSTSGSCTLLLSQSGEEMA